MVGSVLDRPNPSHTRRYVVSPSRGECVSFGSFLLSCFHASSVLIGLLDPSFKKGGTANSGTSSGRQPNSRPRCAPRVVPREKMPAPDPVAACAVPTCPNHHEPCPHSSLHHLHRPSHCILGVSAIALPGCPASCADACEWVRAWVHCQGVLSGPTHQGRTPQGTSNMMGAPTSSRAFLLIGTIVTIIIAWGSAEVVGAVGSIHVRGANGWAVNG